MLAFMELQSAGFVKGPERKMATPSGKETAPVMKPLLNPRLQPHGLRVALKTTSCVSTSPPCCGCRRAMPSLHLFPSTDRQLFLGKFQLGPGALQEPFSE